MGPLKYDSDCSLRLYLRSDIVYASITRGNKFKLVPQHCKYDSRKTIRKQYGCFNLEQLTK